ncbi:hypothetical protein HK097_000264 [Rhizophlyctis rosea]|uniref:lytic cellulose monooxygenase (C4-dehydrogenating) n=1 Tax=Rhizophlyctis rosea TaxID=64517 RepID=A0AAD5S879_9FUNG|nr:hypothetical protein HK097_000264 [Rhizophlyctis rosea]
MFTKTVLAAAVLATAVSAHTNVRGFYVSGKGQAYPTKDWDYCVRPVASNNPLTTYSGSTFQCNQVTGPAAGVCTADAGDEVTMVIHEHGMNEDYAVGGAHHGPIQAYLAKVDNAATTGVTGLKWFKIYERGLIHGGAGRNGIADNVDNASMQYWGTNEANKNKGLVTFKLPCDLAPGDYLLRGELIALHSAGSPGGAQPYVSCAQLRIANGGNGNPATVTDISYSTSDPGLQLAIYGTLNSYTPPGPRVYQPSSCSGGNQNPGTTVRTTTTTRQQQTTTTTRQQQTTTTTQPPRTTTTTSRNTGGSGAPLYGQCGGRGWTGATTCASGTCKVSNEYYSQCLP